jgi:hypothetical protein
LDLFGVKILCFACKYAIGGYKGDCKPFLRFLRSFDEGQAYNMMAIMLDSHFQVLCVVKNLVGCGNAKQLVFFYDVKVVIPFLMVCFDFVEPFC